VAVSNDNKKIASGSGDKRVRLWDLVSGEMIGEPLQGHSKSIICISFNNDGTRVASGSIDKKIKLWQVANGTKLLFTFI